MKGYKNVTEKLETTKWLFCPKCSSKNIQIFRDKDMSEYFKFRCMECKEELTTTVVLPINQ